MKTLKFEDKESWEEARIGKITGTKLKDLISLKGSVKKGFWKLVAERLSLPADDENAMERGIRLEEEAIKEFEKETGKKVDNSLIIWVSDENDSIAVSPDGIIGKTEALEIKCLNSASHIEALLTQELPEEYEFQVLQYFIVNPILKTLYFGFYDPRVLAKPFFYFTINRKDKEKEIEFYKKEQLEILKKVEEIVLKLTF